MRYFLIFTLLVLNFTACKEKRNTGEKEIIDLQEPTFEKESTQQINYLEVFMKNPEYHSNGFDFPVGKPDANGYYNAQKFQENNHLGDDWNGVGGGNSDLGDDIYSSANGYIKEVKDYKGGWGNVVRIIHLHNDILYESLYAHCDSIFVSSNQFIKKGEQIATIGNCNDHYFAHLHLKIRDDINLDIGPGYSTITNGYLDPTDFINKNRK